MWIQWLNYRKGEDPWEGQLLDWSCLFSLRGNLVLRGQESLFYIKCPVQRKIVVWFSSRDYKDEIRLKRSLDRFQQLKPTSAVLHYAISCLRAHPDAKRKQSVWVGDNENGDIKGPFKHFSQFWSTLCYCGDPEGLWLQLQQVGIKGR